MESIHVKLPLENPIVHVPTLFKALKGVETDSSPQETAPSKRKVEIYDKNDPFIDDSDAIVEIAASEVEWKFFVHHGKLESEENRLLVNEPKSKKRRTKQPKKTENKEKKKTEKTTSAVPVVPVIVSQTSDNSASVESLEDVSLKNSDLESKSVKSKKTSKTADAEVAQAVEDYKKTSSNLQKLANELEFKDKKFPTALREILMETILLRMLSQHSKTLDEQFFSELAEFLPYNAEALKKLINTKVVHRAITELNAKVESEEAKLKGAITAHGDLPAISGAMKPVLYDLVQAKMDLFRFDYYLK